MPMLYVNLPDDQTRRLSFYLAMEEFLLDELNDDVLFVWKVEPSVIIGQNQVLADEVNVDYCFKNNINIYRRKSGGGCVFSDLGNLMISRIYRTKDVERAFADHLELLRLSLAGLGIQSVHSSNNDILIAKHKVSGNAVQLTEKGCVVHGTLLFNSDMDMMINAITPSVDKLSKNGVQSVRQRVVNINSISKCTEADFISILKNNLSYNTYTLSEAQIIKVEALEKEYLSESFIYSK